MSDPNRRGFLIAAGATVAGAAAVAAVARSDDSPDPAAPTDAAAAGSEHGEIVAHVHDVRAGTISLMVEGHQVSVTDPVLAARIAGAMRSTTV